MKNYGIPTLLDLVSDGGSAVTVTPGANPQSVEFLIQAPKAGLDDNWPLCTNIICAADTLIDEPAEGTASALTGDEMALVMDSYDVNSPIIGNTHPRDTFTGPIAKHIVEFFCGGYRYSDGMRRQISAVGDTDFNYTHYQILPFAHELFEKPHHSAIWLGWLNATKVKNYVAASTALQAIGSAGSNGIVIGATTIRNWVEFIVSDELIIPTINQWHLYETPASGGTTAIIQGIGTPNGLLDVQDGCRVAALLELTPANGLGGVTDPSTLVGVTIPQFGQDLTVNIDGFYSAFHRAIGRHPVISRSVYPGGDDTPANAVPFASLTTAANAVNLLQAQAAQLTIDDRGGNPYTMHALVGGLPGAFGGVPNPNNLAVADGQSNGGSGNSLIGTMYVPWRAPGLSSQLTKIKKFWGDLKVIRNFGNGGSAPVSGKFRWMTNEMRELGPAKKQQMLSMTGKPATLQRIYSTGTPDPRTANLHSANKRDATLPQRVSFKAPS
jgi:hypothetical protein